MLFVLKAMVNRRKLFHRNKNFQLVFGHPGSYIQNMNRGVRALMWITASLLAAVPLKANTQDTTSYESIVVRNVFNLKPPPNPEDLKPPPAAPPTIKLQGISTILGKKKVLFKVLGTKTGEKEQSYILSEGQMKDEITVKAIDEKKGSIQFDNHGTPQTLTMAEDAAKPVKTSVPPVAARGGIPRPGPTASTAIVRPTGGRGSSLTTIGRGQQSLRQIPTTRSPRTSAAPASAGVIGTKTTKKAEQPQLTREEQTVLIEVDRELNKDKIAAGKYPPLPPTELTPPDAVGMPPAPVPEETSPQQ